MAEGKERRKIRAEYRCKKEKRKKMRYGK